MISDVNLEKPVAVGFFNILEKDSIAVETSDSKKYCVGTRVCLSINLLYSMMLIYIL
jgi:hypothetical protein